MKDEQSQLTSWKDDGNCFGHILRLSSETLAVKAIKPYFERLEKGLSRPRETIVTILNKGITRAR